MRISDAAALVGAVLASGCSAQPGESHRALAAAEANQRAAADDDGMVLCGVGGAPLTRTCSVEQAPSERGLI